MRQRFITKCVRFFITKCDRYYSDYGSGTSTVYLLFERRSLASQNLYFALGVTGSPIPDKIYGKKQKIQANLDETRKFSCLLFA